MTFKEVPGTKVKTGLGGKECRIMLVPYTAAARDGTLKWRGFRIKLLRYLLKCPELESSPTRVGIILPVVWPVREIRGLTSWLVISSW